MAKVFFSFFFTLCFFHLSAYAEAVPKAALTFDFNVRMFQMSRMKEEKILDAVELLRKVFVSAEFKQRILNHQFYGKKKFLKNKGLSNLEIYNLILSGVEQLHPYRNNAMDLDVQLYTDYHSTVLGFTRPNTGRIWINSKYFNRHSPARIAENLMHEWLHKVGFDHDYRQTRDRKYSVPYAIGYIVGELAARMDD